MILIVSTEINIKEIPKEIRSKLQNHWSESGVNPSSAIEVPKLIPKIADKGSDIARVRIATIAIGFGKLKIVKSA